MCGIAGQVAREPADPGRVRRALDAIAHRGPDDATARSFQTPAGGHVDLLHRRLSIIDLDPRANQPFRCGPIWLSYNGELYNYLELREALAREGAEFVTSSDTEVLATVLRRWGWAGLDRCEGMWAFAAYDERDGSLGLCRDRFGEKPLYLADDGDALAFGSEPKALFALLGRAPRPDLAHIRRYLVNGYKSLYKVPTTFIEGMTEVEAGTILHIGADGRRDVERYWRPSTGADEDMSFEEACERTRERLIRSVELRLRADVPLAFCMSGGVDSVSLIAIAQRELGHDVHGFTIVSSDERYEEQDMIDHAVAELGVRHTPIELGTSGFLGNLRALVRQHDAPVYTISYYVQWLLMAQIHAHGYRVSISGTAADELFSGYYDHHLAYLHEVRDDAVLAGASRAAWSEHVQPVVRNPFLSDPDLFVRDPAFRDHIYLNAADIAGYLVEPFAEGFEERHYTDDLLRNRMLNELFAEAVPVILHEDDANAMAYSIENRSPYLDRDLFELSSSIPTRHLVRDGRAKAVLRESMRGIAPDLILDNRRKVGFNANVLELLDTRDPACRDELLRDGPLFDVVRRDRVEELLARDELPNSLSKLLFSIVCAKFFLEEVAA